MLSTVIGMTYGATVDAHVARASGELRAARADGRCGSVRGAAAPARKALTECVGGCGTRSESLECRARTGTVDLGAGGKRVGDPAPAAVNLNTAERSSLILWLKLDAGTADRALASRAAEGPFKDLADFARRAGLTAEREAQLRAGGRGDPRRRPAGT